MPRIEALLVLTTLVAAAGCENTQTVSDAKTQTAPAVQQASLPADRSMPNDLMETPSGLKYKIVKEGDPNKKPTAANSVLAHYEGWLEDGTIFDSSYDRGEPISFPAQRRHRRLDRGPAAYRRRGRNSARHSRRSRLRRSRKSPTIPPNATLTFKVELIEVQ